MSATTILSIAGRGAFYARSDSIAIVDRGEHATVSACGSWQPGGPTVWESWPNSRVTFPESITQPEE